MSVDANIFGRKLKETIIRYLERLCCHSNLLIVLGLERYRKKKQMLKERRKCQKRLDTFIKKYALL